MSAESNLGRLLRRLSGGELAVAAGPPGVASPMPASAAPAVRRVHLTAGQQIGPYRIETEVGRGAMATVCRAQDTRDGRTVALKVLSLGDDWPENRIDEARMRLMREADAASRIQHPDIVEVYEAGEHDGVFFLAMEFVEGVNLAVHATGERLLPPRMVCEMCARVADALYFAHQRGVVHRDIKPANVVFDQRSRRLRVMDFGVARLEDSRATRTGIVLGSPSYMAPEQLDGRPVTAASDLFSLAVMLHQLLTGQLPFRADSMPGLMRKIATEPHTPLGTIRPDLPAELAAIIDRALEKDPGARFASGAEMAQALRDCGRTIDPGLR